MRNIQNFSIVFTFLSLWLAIYMPDSIEEYLACFFILSVGLLHGANDIKIIRTVFADKNLNSFWTILLYIAVVILGTAMFYLVPAFSLVLFILISGYHFGEQHFHYIDGGSRYIKALWFLSYGCSVIFLLLYTNSKESIPIIHQICGAVLNVTTLLYCLLVSVIFFTFCFAYYNKRIESPIRELFYFVVFFLVFKMAILIWAFAIYFVLWHSIPSLIDQIKFLSKEINKKTLFQYVKSSFLYWMVSVIGLFIFFNFLVNETDKFFAIFFSFLAAITFPHVIVMTKIFKH